MAPRCRMFLAPRTSQAQQTAIHDFIHISLNEFILQRAKQIGHAIDRVKYVRNFILY